MKINLEFETKESHEGVEDALCHILGKEYWSTLIDLQMEISGRLESPVMMQDQETAFLRKLLQQISEAPCMDFYR